MLKIETLKKRQDFLRISSRGYKYVTPAFVIQISKNPDLEGNKIRVGYTASRKVGGAVERNRAKRRLRSLVRDLFPQYTKLGYDYVLIARVQCLKHTFEKMRGELTNALQHHHKS